VFFFFLSFQGLLFNKKKNIFSFLFFF